MARVTVEDCVDKIPNRFELVLLAGQRARQVGQHPADGADGQRQQREEVGDGDQLAGAGGALGPRPGHGASGTGLGLQPGTARPSGSDRQLTTKAALTPDDRVSEIVFMHWAHARSLTEAIAWCGARWHLIAMHRGDGVAAVCPSWAFPP